MSPSYAPTEFCKDIYVGVPCIMALQENVDLFIIVDSSNAIGDDYQLLIDEIANEIETSFPGHTDSTLGFAL